MLTGQEYDAWQAACAHIPAAMQTLMVVQMDCEGAQSLAVTGEQVTQALDCGLRILGADSLADVNRD